MDFTWHISDNILHHVFCRGFQGFALQLEATLCRYHLAVYNSKRNMNIQISKELSIIETYHEHIHCFPTAFQRLAVFFPLPDVHRTSGARTCGGPGPSCWASDPPPRSPRPGDSPTRWCPWPAPWRMVGGHRSLTKMGKKTMEPHLWDCHQNQQKAVFTHEFSTLVFLLCTFAPFGLIFVVSGQNMAEWYRWI